MALLTKNDLTEDQLAALDYIYKFLEGPNRAMVLCGAAGTGKTSLINVLLDELDELDLYKYVCTAPTNKAVEVIARNTGRDFDRTIYSIVGLTVKDDDDQKPVLVRENESHLGDYSLVIIDEASMVSTELLMEIESDMATMPKIKVIYVGDKCQIPPVDDTNKGMTDSIVFQMPLKFELTKVMRTALDNPILQTVTTIRENIDSVDDMFDHETKVTDKGYGIFFYDLKGEYMDKMYEYFKSKEYEENSDYAMAVAWTNKAVDAINSHVRAQRYPGITEEYIKGEELRVARPYRRDVKKQVGNKIRNVTETYYNLEERIKISEVFECKDPRYDLECYKMTVSNYRASYHNRHVCTAYVLKSSEREKYKQLRNAMAQEAYAKMKELGHGGRHKYTKQEAWREYNELKNYFLEVDYIYAMTAHRAQGSTIENVFVIERNINRIPETIYRNKLKYTAFTRASKELHVLY